MFNKGVNTHCGVDKLHWNNENNEECSIDCFYQSGTNTGLVKDYLTCVKSLK